LTKRTEEGIAALLRELFENPAARLFAARDGHSSAKPVAADRRREFSTRQVRELVARGLLTEAEGGGFTATAAAEAWLRRRANVELPFRAQHHEIARIRAEPGSGREVLASLDESPVATLSRRAGRSGEPWLPAHAATAAERLRRDFEIGRLQPRVTANWSASVSDGRRSGDNTGLTDLTDMALAARQRFDRAVRAVGPELSGVLIDICCFLKGLETVERERQWPARSAKLVLRLALERLARHYGLMPAATGKPASGRVRHWGAEGYRPEIG
jgi:hypothetical protein